MKILLFIACILFFGGFLLHFADVPGNNLSFISGAFLIEIYCIISVFKYMKKDRMKALLAASFALITVFVLFRMEYWYFGKFGYPITIIGIILTVCAYFYILISKRMSFKWPQLVLSLYFLLFLFIQYHHAHQVFYFMNLNEVVYGETRETDLWNWDKYSWFLYISGEREAAAEANRKALEALHLNEVVDGPYEKAGKRIKEHGEMIRNGTWTYYKGQYD